MSIFNIVISIVGGAITSLFSTFLNNYSDKKKLLLRVCEFVEELTLNNKQLYSRDVILIKLQNFDTQIHFYFNKKIAASYSAIYGDIVQCIRYDSAVTETTVIESYNQFLQNIKFYIHRRTRK